MSRHTCSNRRHADARRRQWRPQAGDVPRRGHGSCHRRCASRLRQLPELPHPAIHALRAQRRRVGMAPRVRQHCPLQGSATLAGSERRRPDRLGGALAVSRRHSLLGRGEATRHRRGLFGSPTVVRPDDLGHDRRWHQGLRARSLRTEYRQERGSFFPDLTLDLTEVSTPTSSAGEDTPVVFPAGAVLFLYTHHSSSNIPHPAEPTKNNHDKYGYFLFRADTPRGQVRTFGSKLKT